MTLGCVNILLHIPIHMGQLSCDIYWYLPHRKEKVIEIWSLSFCIPLRVEGIGNWGEICRSDATRQQPQRKTDLLRQIHRQFIHTNGSPLKYATFINGYQDMQEKIPDVQISMTIRLSERAPLVANISWNDRNGF
jgi:hypothetical protein